MLTGHTTFEIAYVEVERRLKLLEALEPLAREMAGAIDGILCPTGGVYATTAKIEALQAALASYREIMEGK